jgi:hypothetical protein
LSVRRILTVLLALALLTHALPSVAQTSAPAPSSRFAGWASVVVAGEWRSHTEPIQAFDNARRDLVAGFLKAGFSRADMYDATLRPDAAHPTTAREALDAITATTARATRGCLIYFTSHGAPGGMVFGPDREINPTMMAQLVRNWCPDRPTVLVVSACYSGIFVDGLAAPNRMIITAARRDRTSFGCGADAEYPYFDGCIIESLPTAPDFIALANAARACVKRRETAEELTPGSEPQVSIGANMQFLLPTLRFTPQPATGGPPATTAASAPARPAG